MKTDKTVALAVIITLIGIVLVVIALAFQNKSHNDAFKSCIDAGYSDNYCNMMLED